MAGEDDRKNGPTGGDEDFAALLAASEAGQRRLSVGDVVRGRVIGLGATTAFVEVGGKGEAVVDLAEFRDPETGAVRLAVGDELEATVTDDGSESGSIVLKRTIGRGAHLPGELEQAFAHGLAVEGVVTGEKKGGFDVQICGVRAFCPGSQIDRRRGSPAVPAASYVGQRLRFQVTKIDAGGRNVVVSRRQLLEAEARDEAARTWERIKEGAVLDGTVSSVRDFGAFVDLGGVEGLIHVSELGYGRAEHPADVLKPGQPVQVKVVKVEPGEAGGRPRVGLSLRALEQDPWATAPERFPVGAVVRGTVRRLEPFGAFVELVPGVDGLVHVSKMVLDRRISHPRQAVEIGAAVEVTVVSIDPEQRRIGLSMVEQARRERDRSEAAVRQEEEAAVAEMNEARSLGTFADLLAKARKRGD